MNGPRAPYLERLELLASDDVVETHLDTWAAAWGTVPAAPWRRVHGRLRPQRSPWAVLVYQADDGLTVQVRLLEPTDDATVAGHGPALPAGALGRIEILPCEADPAMPGLPAVLAKLDTPRVVRYRPGDRCTVRGGVASGARFVKVFASGIDDQHGARARWQAMSSGAFSFALAEPHGWDEATRSSWYGAVPGGPVLPLLSGPLGTQVARRIGTCLGELAVAPLAPTSLADASVQLARTFRALARAEAAAPTLVDDLWRAREALAHAHQQLAARPLVPVHGAAHLGQWLAEDSQRLGLVDFDRYAAGEPEFDLATFLAEVRAEASSLRSPVDDLERAVLDGFCAVAGEPDSRRLAVYTVHKLLARAARAASALRPDAEARATRQLAKLREPIAALARW